MKVWLGQNSPGQTARNEPVNPIKAVFSGSSSVLVKVETEQG
jgi:hypothetical protein